MNSSLDCSPLHTNDDSAQCNSSANQIAVLALAYRQNSTKFSHFCSIGRTYSSPQCDPGVGMHILYDHIYNKPTKIMLLGAAFSPVSQPIADTSKYWNLLQVSTRIILTLCVTKSRVCLRFSLLILCTTLTFNLVHHKDKIVLRTPPI